MFCNLIVSLLVFFVSQLERNFMVDGPVLDIYHVYT